MKRLLQHIILLAAMACIAPLAMAQSLTEQAAAAYSEDKFAEALNLYLEAADTEGVSDELYYNIGNCYYRMGNNGKAILYYERALNLNPANGDARDNLEFVNNRITDNTNVDATNIIGETMNKIRHCASSNGWAITSIVLFLLLLACVAMYVFSTNVMLRKIGFFGGIVLLVLVVFTNSFAFATYRKISDRKYAIITVPSVTLSTSPRVPKDKSEEAFILNEGTKIYILDSVATKTANGTDTWLDIKADDSHRAWINSNCIDVI